MESTPDKDIRRDVFALMARKGWPMLALRNTDLTLEDLFLQLTSTDAALFPHRRKKAGRPPSWTPTRIWSWMGTRTWRRKRMRILRKRGSLMKAIFKREVRSYFSSPVGYVFVAVLAALYGFYYFQAMLSSSSSYIADVFAYMFSFSMMIIPIITMRSMTDDQKNKTDQALLTAPVGVASIVLGKFFACWFVYFIATTLGAFCRPW